MAYEEEIRRLEDVIARNPNDFEALFDMGILYEKEGNIDKAATCFMDSLDAKPSFEKSRFELGIALSIKKSYDLALKEWERIKDEDEDYHFSTFKVQHKTAIIDALRAWGDYEKTERQSAYTSYTLAFAYYCLRQLDKALSHCQNAISLDERFNRAQYLRGLICEEKGDFEEAVRAFTSDLGSGSETANLHYHLGIALQHRGMTQKALAAMQKAVELKHRYMKAYYRLGVLYYLQGQNDEAQQNLKTALYYNPRYAEANVALGNVFFSLYRMDEAADEYEQALASNPSLKEASVRLGELRKSQGKMDEALVHFERALALDPMDADVHYHTGNIYLQQKRYDNAIESLKKATASRPQDGTLLYSLAQAYSTLGRHEEALEAYRRVMSLDPQNSTARRSLGKALFRKADFRAALKEFEQVLREDPRDQSARHYYALSNLFSGSPEKARQEYLAMDDPSEAFRHLCLGASHIWNRDPDKALEEMKKGTALLPDDYSNPHLWGTIMVLAGTIVMMNRKSGDMTRPDKDYAGQHGQADSYQER